MDLIISQLDHQSPERSRLARNVFHWLSVARRPLTVRELQQAVSSGSSAMIDDPNRLPAPSLIISVCLGFVQIDCEKDRIFTIPSALPFYFYQFGHEFAEQANQYAATSCQALIESNTLSHGPFTSQNQYDEMERTLPFGDYVSQNWGVHLEDAGDEDITNRILENDSLLETLSQLLHVSSHRETSCPRRFDSYPIGFGRHHFAAYFGLTVAFDKWTTQEDWNVPRDSWNRGPFHVSFCSPGLQERHTLLYPLFNDPEFAYELLTGVELMDSHDDSHEKPLRHESIKRLPWTWRIMRKDHHFNGCEHTALGKNFQRLYDLTKKELEEVGKDGKGPLHHFVVHWNEGTFLTLLNCLTEKQVSKSTGSSDSNTSSSSDTIKNNVKSQLMEAHDFGQTLLDYTFEKGILFGYLVLGFIDLSPQELKRSIVIAAFCNHTALVKQLYGEIRQSHRMGEDFGVGQTVIEASKHGNADVIRWLLAMGVDLNIQDDEGMSPLHHAAYGGHVDTFQFLLLEGVDPNQLDKTGRSSLYCACESGSDTIITLLSEKGVSASRPNAEGRSQLHLAAQKNDVDARFETEGSGTQSPLHIAARKGHDAIVKLLVRHGVATDRYDTDLRTPLSYASEGGHLEIVKTLLTSHKFARVDGVDRYGRTALSHAADWGYTNVVAALLGLGCADPNIQDFTGKTATMYAAKSGHIDTVVVLTMLTKISYDVLAAASTEFREVYYQYANQPRGNAILDLNLKDSEGRSAMFYLKQRNDEESSHLIQYLTTIDLLKV
ncbi:ankyrin repeat-containing domain protein [Xylaria arbuscula]|nr:ankyrin repeat-containing domain protein [Xylaria arbuscula]